MAEREGVCLLRAGRTDPLQPVGDDADAGKQLTSLHATTHAPMSSARCSVRSNACSSFPLHGKEQVCKWLAVISFGQECILLLFIGRERK